MSRHLTPVPANDLIHNASVFNREQLMNHVNVTEHERRAEARYLNRHGADDLTAMILGDAA
ncbi:hypothetical protein [Paenarthrobacter sp. NPDC018779]|uniref:hypothetical protein n=1 Tax=Paenarthrobacter sp. NPDC018779 TaxID=3364375 RepID=UPI0037CC6CBE